MKRTELYEAPEREDNFDTEKHENGREALLKKVDEFEKLIGVVPPYCHWNKEMLGQLADSHRENIEEFLGKENEWRIYINNNYRELAPKFSTGSNSGSLIGFSDLRGLVPTGQIMSEHPDQVPFSGELFCGVSQEGINQNGLSFTTNMRTAISYAETPISNNLGWNPEISKKNILSMMAEIAEMENNSRTSKEKYLGQDLFQLKLDALKFNIQIEQRRQQVYERLTEIERSFVTKPFPVVYGVLETADMNTDNYEKVYCDLQGEFKHCGRLSADESKSGQLVAYCPAEKIKEVQEYFKQKNIFLTVHPLEAIKKYLKIANLNTFLEELRQKKEEMETNISIF